MCIEKWGNVCSLVICNGYATPTLKKIQMKVKLDNNETNQRSSRRQRSQALVDITITINIFISNK